MKVKDNIKKVGKFALAGCMIIAAMQFPEVKHSIDSGEVKAEGSFPYYTISDPLKYLTTDNFVAMNGTVYEVTEKNDTQLVLKESGLSVTGSPSGATLNHAYGNWETVSNKVNFHYDGSTVKPENVLDSAAYYGGVSSSIISKADLGITDLSVGETVPNNPYPNNNYFLNDDDGKSYVDKNGVLRYDEDSPNVPKYGFSKIIVPVSSVFLSEGAFSFNYANSRPYHPSIKKSSLTDQLLTGGINSSSDMIRSIEFKLADNYGKITGFDLTEVSDDFKIVDGHTISVNSATLKANNGKLVIPKVTVNANFGRNTSRNAVAVNAVNEDGKYAFLRSDNRSDMYLPITDGGACEVGSLGTYCGSATGFNSISGFNEIASNYAPGEYHIMLYGFLMEDVHPKYMMSVGITDGYPLTVIVKPSIDIAPQSNPILQYGESQTYTFTATAPDGYTLSDTLLTASMSAEDQELADMEVLDGATSSSISVKITPKTANTSISVNIHKDSGSDEFGDGNYVFSKSITKKPITLKTTLIENTSLTTKQIEMGESFDSSLFSYQLTDDSAALVSGDSLPSAGYTFGVSGYTLSDGKFLTPTTTSNAKVTCTFSSSNAEAKAFTDKYNVNWQNFEYSVNQQTAEANWISIPENPNMDQGFIHYSENVVIQPSQIAIDKGFTKIKRKSDASSVSPASTYTVTDKKAVGKDDTFVFYKENGAYSTELAAGKDIIVDKTAPVIDSIDVEAYSSSEGRSTAVNLLNMLTGGAFYNDGFKVTVKASDSAVKSITLYKNEEEANNNSSTVTNSTINFSSASNGQKTAEFIITGEYSGKVFAKAVDYAGNESSVMAASNTITNTTEALPTQELTLSSDSPSGYINEDDMNATVTAIDRSIDITAGAPFTGIKAIRYYVGEKQENGTITYGSTGTQIYAPAAAPSDIDDAAIEKTYTGTYDLKTLLENTDIVPVNKDTLYLKIEVESNAGNTTSTETSVTYDYTKPVTATPVVTDATKYTNSDKKITFTVNEAGSGIDGKPVVTKEGDASTTIEVVGTENGKGTAVSYYFMAPSNGTYHIDVSDVAENAADQVDVTVEKIDKTVPLYPATSSNPVLDPAADVITNSRNVKVFVSDRTADDSGIKKSNVTITAPSGVTKPTISCTGPEDTSGSLTCDFTVTKDGTYTVKAVDNAGNEAEKEITISNMDTDTPVIGDVSGHTGSDGDDWAVSRTVSVNYTDAGASTTVSGSIADVEGRTTPIVSCTTKTDGAGTCSFTAVENGSYALTLSDEAGNASAVKNITVSQIDADEPTIAATQSNATGKVQHAEFTITTGAASGLKTLKAFYSSEETGSYTETVINDAAVGDMTWSADANGWYYFEITNKADNTADTSSAKIHVTNINTTPLTTTVVKEVKNSDGTYGSYDEGWTNKEIRLSLSANTTSDTGTSVTYQKRVHQEGAGADENWEDIMDGSDKSNIVTINTLTNEQLEFRAISESGVKGGATSAITVKYDDTAPNTPTIKNASEYGTGNWYGYLKDIEAEFTKKALNGKRDDSLNEHLVLKVDGAEKSLTNGTWVPDAQGTYAISFTVVDAAGNESAAATTTLNVDTDAPDLKLSYKKNGSADALNALTGGLFFNDTIDVKVEMKNAPDSAVESGIKKYEYKIVKKNETAGDISWTSNGTVDTFQVSEVFDGSVYAKATSNSKTETAGQYLSGETHVDDLMLEKTVPVITFSEYSTNWTSTNTIKANISDGSVGAVSGISDTDGKNYFTTSLDSGGTKTNLRGGDNTLTLADGTQTITVRGEDKAGNTTDETLAVKIDATAPVVSITEPSQVDWKVSRTVSYTASDVTSGIAAGYPKVSGPDNEDVTTSFTEGSGSFSAEKNGTYKVTVKDNAGNEETADVVISKLDTTVPVIKNVTNTGTQSSDVWKSNSREVQFKITTGESELNTSTISLTHGGTAYANQPVQVGEAQHDTTAKTYTYTYKFKAEENADETTPFKLNLSSVSGKTAVEKTITTGKIDKKQVTIAFERTNPVDSGTATRNVQVQLTINTGLSGIDALNVYKKHNGTYGEGEEITTTPTVTDTADGKQYVYSYNVSANGTYKFEAVNAAEADASDSAAAALKNADVEETFTNIDNTYATSLITRTYGASDTEYTSGSWVNEDVKIHIIDSGALDPSGSVDAHDNATYHYRTKQKNGDWGSWIEMSDGGNITCGNEDFTASKGDEATETVSRRACTMTISPSQSGDDAWMHTTYQFRTTGNRGVDDVEEASSIANTESVVKIDKVTPDTPAVTNASDYTNTNWYSYAKAMSAGYTAKTGRGTDYETLQIKVDSGDWETASADYTPDTKGSHTILYRVKDKAGNTSAETTAYNNWDDTAPAVTLTYQKDVASGWLSTLTGGIFYNNTLQVKMSVDNTGDIDAGIKGYAYKLNEGTWTDTAASTTNTFNVAPEFTGSVHARVSTNAKNSDGTFIHTDKTIDDITLETSLPTIALSIDNDAWRTTNALKITVNEGTASIESGLKIGADDTYYSVDGKVNKTALAVGENDVVLDDGEYDVDVQVKDKAGNTATKTQAVKIDVTKPSVSVTNPGKDNWAKERTVNFTASDATSGIADTYPKVSDPDNEDVTVTFASGSGSFSATKNGTYTVTVKDKAGNTETKSVTIEKLDTTAVVIKDIVNDGTAQSDPWETVEREVSFSITTGESGINGTPVVSLTSGGTTSNPTLTKTSTSDASHIYTYKFTAGDNADYTIDASSMSGVNAAQKTGTIEKIDHTTPTVNVIASNGNDLPASSVTFTLSLTDIGSSGVDSVKVFYKENDGADYDSGTAMTLKEDGDYEYTTTSNGIYQFVATNKAGSTNTELTKTLTKVSNTEPSTKITAVFDGTSDTYDGSWTNKDVSVKVENTQTGVNQANATFEVSKDNGVNWISIADPDAFVISEELLNTTWLFRAVSESNVADSTPAQLKIRMDKKAVALPAVTDADTFTANDWYAITKNVAATSTKKTNRDADFKEWIEYELDGDGTWVKADNYTQRVDGSHTIKFRSHDNAGNTSSESSAVHIQVDTTAPQYTVSYKKNTASEWLNFLTGDLFYNETIDVKMEVTNTADLESGVKDYSWQKVDKNGTLGTAWTTSTDGTFNIPAEFGGDIHTRVRSNAQLSDASYKSTTTKTTNVYVETTEPSITITGNKADWSNTNKIKVNLADNGSVASGITPLDGKNYWYTSKDSDHKALVNGDNNVTLADGEYTLNIHAQDRAGNSKDTAAAVKIDTVKPIIVINALDQSGYAEQRTVSFTASDARSLLDGDPVVTGGANVTLNWDGTNGSFEVTQNGTYTIKVKDHAGNETTSSIVIKKITHKGNIKNEDGSVIVPGKDGTLETDDDVIAKPGDTGTVEIKDNGDVEIAGGGSIVLPQPKPDGTEIELPNGGTLTPDGDVQLPNGDVMHPDGTLDKPNGDVVVPGPDGKPGTDDDIVIRPDEDGNKPEIDDDGNISVKPGGDVETPGGDITLPDGGTITVPDGDIVVPGPDGKPGTSDDVVLTPDEDGNIVIPGPDGKPGTDDDIIVHPGGDTSIDSDGNISVKPGGEVETGDGTIDLPDGGIVKPDGDITVPGSDGKPGTSDDITVRPGEGGSVIVPGKDGKLPTKDDVIAYPGKDNNVSVDGNGNVEIPGGGHVHIPSPLPKGSDINLPNGGVLTPDGDVYMPDGSILHPDGVIEKTDGSIVVPGPDGTPGGNDDIIIKPNDEGDKPIYNGDGSVTIPDGGYVVDGDGNTSKVEGGGTVDGNGSIKDKDGKPFDPGRKPDDSKPSDNKPIKPTTPKPDDTTDTKPTTPAGTTNTPENNGTQPYSPKVDVDKDGDGIADVNIDIDGDGIADVNIDTTGDGKADYKVVRLSEGDVTITRKDMSTYFADGTSVSIKDVTDKPGKALTKASAKLDNIIKIYDISMVVEKTSVQPDGTVIVTINLKQLEGNYKKLKLFKVLSDNTLEEVKFTIKDNKLTYETDELTPVILTGIKDGETPKAGGNKNDNTMLIVAGAAGVALVGTGSTVFVHRRNKGKKKA